VDIKERLGMPVLAQIPLVDGLESKNAEWLRPLAVEAFYQLVASLRYSSTHPPRTIAFTSADQGDGKSTIALNTAISLGQMKARVLIVDADLRRPTMHTKLGVANETGLSDVLVGVAALDDAIRPTEHPGVSVLPSGRPAPNPVGLLQSEQFETVLKQARDRFDFVIVDGPALRSIVDGIVLGVKTEGTVLIVSSTSSEGRGVRSAIERLRSVGGINLLGVVLNRARPDRNAASNYYLGAGATVSLTPGTPG
jgi:capsular exopolysaccharide synthesis family protein